MKKLQMITIISFVLFFGTAMDVQAAVNELIFGYGKTTSPGSLPTTWVQRSRPESISDEYQLNQETFSFNQGEYVSFLIGLVNIDAPGSLFIDKIELTGPSGSIPISNSGFEIGTSGWSTRGGQTVAGSFSVSPDAYAGSGAAKLTVSNSGSYSLRGPMPVAITQSGEYILSVYTKVYEAEREIPSDDIFGMGVGNQWVYDSNVKREITKLDSTTFGRDTYEMAITVGGTQTGKEWYEVWEGYLRLWGLFDSGMYDFGFGLLAAWFPMNVGDHKESMAWVQNYATTVDLKVDVLGIDPVTLNFDTLNAYRLRYNLTASGPGGTAGTSYDWWIVPHIGVVKQQSTGGDETLVSFIINRGFTMTETSDNDNDGILDYRELVVYKTDPTDSDSDDDSLSDGDEINLYGTNPNVFDTDNDGLGDGDEIITHGTDPNDPDSDDDGLSDGDEINNYNTDPKSTDSEADGMPDGWEVTYGLNPTVNDSIEDLDGDGISNIEEYNDTTNPNNGIIASTAALYLPVENATEVALSPTLETEAYDGTAAHTKTQWQISMADSTADGDFSQIVFNLTSLTRLETVKVPEFILEPDQLYSWRARFYDIHNGGVVWSDTRWFTSTATTDINPVTGVPDSQAVPDGTLDLDNDGNLDTISNTYKFVNSTDFSGQVGVKVGGGTSIDCLKAIAPADIKDNYGKPERMPLGLVQFKIAGVTPGATVTAEVYFSEAAPAGAKWYKFDPVNGWQDYSAHATFSADRKSITLEIKDGDYGDCDGTENGTVIDPSGLGTVIPDGNIGGGGGGGGCFIATAAF